MKCIGHITLFLLFVLLIISLSESQCLADATRYAAIEIGGTGIKTGVVELIEIKDGKPSVKDLKLNKDIEILSNSTEKILKENTDKIKLLYAVADSVKLLFEQLKTDYNIDQTKLTILVSSGFLSLFKDDFNVQEKLFNLMLTRSNLNSKLIFISGDYETFYGALNSYGMTTSQTDFKNYIYVDIGSANTKIGKVMRIDDFGNVSGAATTVEYGSKKYLDADLSKFNLFLDQLDVSNVKSLFSGGEFNKIMIVGGAPWAIANYIKINDIDNKTIEFSKKDIRDFIIKLKRDTKLISPEVQAAVVNGKSYNKAVKELTNISNKFSYVSVLYSSIYLSKLLDSLCSDNCTVQFDRESSRRSWLFGYLMLAPLEM